MEKSIRYNGHTAQPSDYETPDGDLALSLGLIHEDESLRPILPPQPLFELPDGYYMGCIHQTSSFKHYILYKKEELGSLFNYTLYWLDNANVTPGMSREEVANNLEQITGYLYTGILVPKFAVIGNTIVVTDDSMRYILWSSGYKYLGNHIPEMRLRMGLMGRPRFYSVANGSTFNVSFNSIPYNDLLNGKTLSEENQTKFTEQIMSKLNKFMADCGVNHGRHCLPFFVRYALRLYDDSLVMHSLPILMNPCTTGGPVLTWSGTASGGNISSIDVNIMLMAATLTYMPNENLSDFTKWKDIVKSVDIFITKPIYTYDQDGKIKSTGDENNFSTKFIGKLYVARDDRGEIEWVRNGDPAAKSRPILKIFDQNNTADGLVWSTYSEWTFAQIYAMYFKPDRAVPSNTIHLPEFDGERMQQAIDNESSFYLLKSIPIEEIITKSTGTIEETEIVTPNDYLPSLTSREVMTDDYQTHDSLLPVSTFVYNSRLNIANIKRTMFGGFAPEIMWARCSHQHSFNVDETDTTNHTITIRFDQAGATGYNDTKVYTYINNDGNVIVVENDAAVSKFIADYFSYTQNGTTYNRSFGSWLFYPDRKATKIVVEQSSRRLEIPLKEHPMLNGAYAMIPYESERNATAVTIPQTDNIIQVPNKIYTSEVNNPFFFPLLGINTVGTGRILGLASSVKALSQGQFGQFPLYAFTTDGVWALEVASNGSYSARQPVTRDVCISMASITQLDSSVVFATDRGLMMLQGSDAISITDDINLEDEADMSALRGLQSVCDSSLANALTIKPLLDFIRDCRLVYDYTHQHIIVYNPNEAYAYVFSLKSKKWGMMYSTLKESLNSYPDAICVEASGQNDVVVNYSKTAITASTEMPFVVVSRPIKFDLNDVLKTVDTIIQRGVIRRGDVKTLLYGSRDLYHWNLVYTSNDHYLRGFRGTPYKYFRIALVGALTKEGRIFGCEASFTPRLVDQLR